MSEMENIVNQAWQLLLPWQLQEFHVLSDSQANQINVDKHGRKKEAEKFIQIILNIRIFKDLYINKLVDHDLDYEIEVRRFLQFVL